MESSETESHDVVFDAAIDKAAKLTKATDAALQDVERQTTALRSRSTFLEFWSNTLETIAKGCPDADGTPEAERARFLYVRAFGEASALACLLFEMRVPIELPTYEEGDSIFEHPDPLQEAFVDSRAPASTAAGKGAKHQLSQLKGVCEALDRHEVSSEHALQRIRALLGYDPKSRCPVMPEPAAPPAVPASSAEAALRGMHDLLRAEESSVAKTAALSKNYSGDALRDLAKNEAEFTLLDRVARYVSYVFEAEPLGSREEALGILRHRVQDALNRWPEG